MFANLKKFLASASIVALTFVGLSPIAAQATETYTLSGTVTDAETGAPVINSQISACNSEGSCIGSSADESGNYSFTGLAADIYDVRAATYTAPRYYDSQESADLSSSDATLNFTLSPWPTGTSTLLGKITDRSQTPIESASVSLQAYGDARNYHLSTSASGDFEFAELKEGIYQVVISATGFFTWQGRISLSEGANLVLNPALDSQGANTLSGKVTNASSGNAVANLELWGCTARTDISWCQNATTDASGNYSFSGVPTGRVNVWGNTQALRYENMNAYAVVADGSNTLNISLKPYPAGSGKISGVVKDTSGVALKDVAVNLWSENGRGYNATTASDGKYKFENLPDGKYWVHSYKSGYISGASKSVTISSGSAVTTDLALKKQPTGVLTGTVTEKGAPDTTIANVYVAVCSSGDFKICVSAYSDEQGNYQISGVPSGTLTLVARPQEGYEAIKNKSITFAGDEMQQDLELTAIPIGENEIEGTLTDISGNPLEGLVISLTVNTNEWDYEVIQTATTTTDATGKYSFSGLAAGYAYVSASGGELTDFNSGGRLSGGNLTLDGKLYPKDANLDLTVQLKDVITEEVTPLASGYVYITITKGGSQIGFSDSQVNESGMAHFEGLARVPGAKYSVYSQEIPFSGFIANDNEYTIHELETGENSRTVSIYTHPGDEAKFTAKVKDDTTETPLGGVDFNVDLNLDSEGKYFYRQAQLTSDEQGNIELPNLPLGASVQLIYSPWEQITNGEAYGDESGYQELYADYRVVSLNDRPRTIYLSKGSPEEVQGEGIYSGLVTDSDGNPVSNAEFYVYASDYSRSWPMMSDDTGLFSLDGLPNGNYIVEFNSNGVYAGFNKGTEFEISTEQPVVANQNIVLVNSPTGSSELYGQIYDSVDKAGVAGIEVHANLITPKDDPETTIDESTLMVDYNAQDFTDQDGNWELKNLPAGRYSIEYWFNYSDGEGGAESETKIYEAPKSTFADVEKGAIVTLARTSIVHYTPSESTLQMQPIDAETRLPVPQKLNCMINADLVFAERNASTDETGTANFKGLVAGQTYYATCYPTEWNKLYIPYKRQTFVAKSGNQTLKLPLQLIDLAASLSGYVRDAQGEPVANVEVSAGQSFSFENCRCGDGVGGHDYTDDNGYYEIYPLPSDGVTTLRAAPTRGNLADVLEQVSFEDGPNTHDFTLQVGAKVGGEIVDSIGGGISSSITLISQDSGKRYSTSGSGTGKYIMPSTVALGDYIVYFGGWSNSTNDPASGYLKADGTLTSDKTLAQVITIDKPSPEITLLPKAVAADGASITGKVSFKTATGETLTSDWFYALARLYTKTGTGWEQIPDKEGWIQSSVDGVYTISGLPAGKYKIQFGDYWITNARYETVYNGGATSLETASEITLTSGQVLKNVNATLKLKKPSENVATLTLEGFDDSELSALENEIGLTTTSTGVQVEATEDLAGEWIAVVTTTEDATAEPGVQSAAEAPTVTKSSWVQLDKNAKAKIPTSVFKSSAKTVIIGNSANTAIGWSSIKKASLVGDGVISGTVKKSKTISVATEWDASPAPALTYQWYYCKSKPAGGSSLSKSASCKTISGATKSSYKIASSYASKYLAVKVSAKNSAGTATTYVATGKVSK